jgi:hypothetical protein
MSTDLSSHPLAPWLDLVRSTLPALKQLGAALPLVQAQCAQQVKAALQLHKDAGALQNAAAFALLEMQLNMLGTQSPARAAQGLLDVQVDTITQLCTQWKTQSDSAAQRAEACVDTLRQAQSQDDVAFVVAGYMNDTHEALQKSAGEAAMLLNAASAGADLLAHRLLDALIAQPAAPAAAAAAAAPQD